MEISVKPDGRIECIGTAVSIEVSGIRGAVRLTFFGIQDKRLFIYLVREDARPMTALEREQHPEIICPHVVIWKLIDGPLGGGLLPGVDDTNQFIADFLKAYQLVNGYGCCINGQWHPALVEIIPRQSPLAWQYSGSGTIEEQR
ncbi:hypothetical protein [Novosphingobium sp. SG919]|nr:hypothetical protein [Novosphingobium sp. SG919]NMN06022.1 hypothetical protein [Novosphingobium sp. SG919]NMN88319.1 hypothetical protein [Novosphingobium sp. SG916]